MERSSSLWGARSGLAELHASREVGGNERHQCQHPEQDRMFVVRSLPSAREEFQVAGGVERGEHREHDGKQHQQGGEQNLHKGRVLGGVVIDLRELSTGDELVCDIWASWFRRRMGSSWQPTEWKGVAGPIWGGASGTREYNSSRQVSVDPEPFAVLVAVFRKPPGSPGLEVVTHRVGGEVRTVAVKDAGG